MHSSKVQGVKSKVQILFRETGRLQLAKMYTKTDLAFELLNQKFHEQYIYSGIICNLKLMAI